MIPGIDCTRKRPDPRGITVKPFPRTFNFLIALNTSSSDISYNTIGL